ncbi:ATP-dependent DNA helicase [Nocardioides massiliensis]|uniref:DNA 5'-3' helicase n=1 Tax=Nocardioides massiliensis TaxID=1325935 RepID=A0ABT9NQQ9_9ACTN|nr:ATP-dependent DNA helicase [Nocardioides massiliensis]MDP9822718.1 ATP-dependent DNA helicase DinG [Nocardioides massiliensis]
MPSSEVRELLATAVEGLGGQERAGQVAMAEAVAHALGEGEHLLVQAGTGTGKSLGYLVPSLLHGKRVVVATATLALQHQLVERDLPALIGALGDRFSPSSYAVLKGRGNYACLHRIREGVPSDQGALVDIEEVSNAGAEVLELREWVEEQASEGGTGERDHAPRHTERAWRQVSVSHRECLGASRCPFGQECFAEQAKERAHRAQLVITNHSLLAIDAIEGVPMLPDYDAVVIDEAHELVARVTQAATDELSAPEVERASRRAARHVGDGAVTNPADALADAGEALRDVLANRQPGRIDELDEELKDVLAEVRDAARALISALGDSAKQRGSDGEVDAGLTQARGWAQEIFAHAERMVANSEHDVLWINVREQGRGGPQLCVAPLQVWGTLRDRLLSEKTAVFTSATLKLGGDFGAVATSLGLKPEDDELPWTGLDVGSPFDYAKQGILYVARHLPAPGRDGLAAAHLAEIVDLVDAADGRTLGLFSSRRAAEAAGEAVREHLPHLTTMVQGEAQLPELSRIFAEDPHANLFGTLSLWQGIDVPGETCQLVIIDRIPFPRPDDPLMSARQRAADKAGRNGFMSVAATHAALLLAQGAGRLIRSMDDRGVVAVLDSRLATARYGGFLRSSLPLLWPTSDAAVVKAALRRLSGQPTTPA